MVALQEVRGNLFNSSDNQARTIGADSSMASLFVPNEMGYCHAPYGNGLLTRIPLLMHYRIPLVSNNDHGFRGALLTQFRFRGQTINLLSTHVDRGTDRELQIKEIVDIYLSLAEPSILMGDLNTEISHPQLQRLLNSPRVVNALDHYERAGVHGAHIDWIMTRGFQTVDAGWTEDSGSDHPLVRAELTLIDSPTNK